MSNSKRTRSGHPVGGSHGDPLARFLPAVQKWFAGAVGTPSPPQVQAWPHIDVHENVLVHAPTGSGKTLAAFLSAINRLFASEVDGKRRSGIDTLYISPLKALNYDIERNLRLPLEGIRQVASERGETLPEITAEVRTGDTPSSVRARIVRRPPHILITTPESLYLLLTSPQARNILRTVRTVIVDEIHSLSGTKRGVHLALSLERLEKLSPEFQRIGLSATQKPLEEVARFLGGQRFVQTDDGRVLEPRPVRIIDAQFEKKLEVQVIGMPDREIGDDRGFVWGGIIPRVLEDIRANRTTLVFANSRRQAERSADRLNAQLRAEENGTQANLGGGWAAANTNTENGDDLLGPFYAHHGSISDETRHMLEEALKAGELPALVGTSSLELGIDIGTVDLVVQLQSPKTVTQGLQRVGRSGHRVGETSRYRIYATHEEDLLESAVIARGMVAGDVEAVYTPQNALDVLSQQIVAAVASDDWDVDALFDLVRCAYPYHELARSSYEGVLKLVSGKYPRHIFSTLRARVNWDETGGMLRALPGTRMHAVDNGGAIVDRGAFPVYLSDRKTRIGELDEEFVYETKEGDAFVLGSQVWRAADIDDDRVIVKPAPGAVPRMPFWRGEFPWRPLQLSETLAEFKSEIAERLRPFVDEETDPPEVMAWLQRDYFCDEPAARQIVNYVRRQLRSTGDIASDRSLMIETYSDPIGDRRIVVHSPFGGKVNGPWSVALSSVIKERTGLEPQVEVNDDGILFRLPEFDDGLVGDLLSALDPEQTRERVLAGLSDSALFGALFRQNAQRALLLPGQRRGHRTAFWLQRLRSKDLLAASRGLPDFPVVLETYRDCLDDAMDLPGLLRVVQALGDGRISVTRHESAAPSPVARSLSYALEAWYMYQWDAPEAERSLQTLGLDRNQLAELMRDPSFAGTLRQEAVFEVESQVAHTAPGRRARSATELSQLLEELGDLTDWEVLRRCDGDADEWLARLESEGRIVRVGLASESAWCVTPQADEYRVVVGLGAEPGPSEREALRNVVRRLMGRSGPVTEQEICERYGLPASLVTEELEAMAADDELAWGYFTAGAGGREWAARQNLEWIQSRTLALLRSEIRPASPLRYQAELLRLQGLAPGSRATGATGLRQVLHQLRGIALTPVQWTAHVLPARVTGFNVGLLEQVVSGGDFVPMLTTSGINTQHQISFVPRSEGNTYLSDEVVGRVSGLKADFSGLSGEVMEFINQQGTASVADLRTAFSHLPLSETRSALSTLVKTGAVTTNSWIAITASLQHEPDPRRGVAYEQPTSHGARRSPVGARSSARRQAVRHMRELTSGLPDNALFFPTGRFKVLGKQQDAHAVAQARAEALLRRHGVVSRHVLEIEGSGWDWSSLVNALSLMELRGAVRRGYFVLGLPGVQFALPETVEQLRRSMNGTADDYTVIAAGDIAYVMSQQMVDASDGDASMLTGVARIPSTHIVFHGEAPVLRSEAAGERLAPANDADTTVVASAVRALRDQLVPPQGSYGNHMTVRTWAGVEVIGSTGERLLEDAGFRRDHPAMTFDAVQSRVLTTR